MANKLKYERCEPVSNRESIREENEDDSSPPSSSSATTSTTMVTATTPKNSKMGNTEDDIRYRTNYVNFTKSKATKPPEPRKGLSVSNVEKFDSLLAQNRSSLGAGAVQGLQLSPGVFGTGSSTAGNVTQNLKSKSSSNFNLASKFTNFQNKDKDKDKDKNSYANSDSSSFNSKSVTQNSKNLTQNSNNIVQVPSHLSFKLSALHDERDVCHYIVCSDEKSFEIWDTHFNKIINLLNNFNKMVESPTSY